jgi:hypothetical protein
MTYASITNPTTIASPQKNVVSDIHNTVEKSDAQMLDDMMSSERGECSPAPDLFIEEDVPLISPQQPVRISKANSLFPKPVPIIAGSRRSQTELLENLLICLLNNCRVRRYIIC